jgi:hypothetical protein
MPCKCIGPLTGVYCMDIQYRSVATFATPMSFHTLQIARQVRNRCDAHIVDHSDTQAGEVAVYTLSDPRDLRLVRYVGQTTSPRKRYLQHVAAAKLWLPDELPWWIKSPRKRPLHEWIRGLYRDEFRLPMMAVVAWTQPQHALTEERRHILELLGYQLPLLNRESALSRKNVGLVRHGDETTRAIS